LSAVLFCIVVQLVPVVASFVAGLGLLLMNGLATHVLK